MRLDSTVAAYGILQVVFADITDRLAIAVFLLRQARGDQGVRFKKIFSPGLKHILDEFKDELKYFGMHHPSLEAEIGELRVACKNIGAFGQWRNDRVHARVRQVADGFALYDWRTGNRLSINLPECEDILQKLMRKSLRSKQISRSWLAQSNSIRNWMHYFGRWTPS